MRKVDGYKTKLSDQELIDNINNLYLDVEENAVDTIEGWWERYGDSSAHLRTLKKMTLDPEGELIEYHVLTL